MRLQCRTCNQITEGIGTIICPNCGHDKPIDLLQWPDLTAQTYFDLLKSLLAEEDMEKQKVGLVIFCTIGDLLFADTLEILLVNLGTDLRVKNFIIESKLAESKREELFHKLTGEKVDEFLKRNGYCEFVKDYKYIRNMRNTFVHHELHSIGDEDIKKVEKLSGDILDVFMSINNEFCVK